MSEKAKVTTMDFVVEMIDGERHLITIQNPELVRWDINRIEKKWPQKEEAGYLFLTFVSWSRMKRAGLYAGEFEPFRYDDCVLIEDADDPKVVRPTKPAPAHDSRSRSRVRSATPAD